MSYGQRINRLLFKIQQAERLDSLQLATALIGRREETGKWEVYRAFKKKPWWRMSSQFGGSCLRIWG